MKENYESRISIAFTIDEKIRKRARHTNDEEVFSLSFFFSFSLIIQKILLKTIPTFLLAL